MHLPQEIELFWNSNVTGASVLFLSNRYFSLLSQGLQLANPRSDKVCRHKPAISMYVRIMTHVLFDLYIECGNSIKSFSIVG